MPNQILLANSLLMEQNVIRQRRQKSKKQSCIFKSTYKYMKTLEQRVTIAVKNFSEILDDLNKLYGRKPYDGSSNICKDDAHFGNSIEKKYGKNIAELKKLVNFK